MMQAVDKTRHPVKTTSYSMEDGFTMPSILLCSFGSYNLTRLNAVYPAMYTSGFEVFQNFSNMQLNAAHNHTNFSNVVEMNVPNAFGQNDLITYTQSGGKPTDYKLTGLPHVSLNASGDFNFSTPQLLGLIRSSAIVNPNTVEQYNNMTGTRWCVMWTPYRLTLDHPPSASSPQWATDTGSATNRQLDPRQVFSVEINLVGTAVQEDQAWQYVKMDSGGPNGVNYFPRILSVQFVDFAGEREEEWLNGSASSEYLNNVLSTGDPDGFEFLQLDNDYQLSVQKEVTTTLSRFQMAGWPWTPWPWSDSSAYQVRPCPVTSSKTMCSRAMVKGACQHVRVLIIHPVTLLTRHAQHIALYLIVPPISCCVQHTMNMACCLTVVVPFWNVQHELLHNLASHERPMAVVLCAANSLRGAVIFFCTPSRCP